MFIAVGKRIGSLYYLECKEDRSLGATGQSKEGLWYRHLGHLGEHGLIELAKNLLDKVLTMTLRRMSLSVKPVLGVSISKVNFRSATHDVKSHWVWFTVIFVER